MVGDYSVSKALYNRDVTDSRKWARPTGGFDSRRTVCCAALRIRVSVSAGNGRRTVPAQITLYILKAGTSVPAFLRLDILDSRNPSLLEGGSYEPVFIRLSR